MEWMLARAAGYNAGFAMVARLNDLRQNSATNILLDAIREWELARNTNAFTDEQREALKIPSNEFHLEKLADRKWKLYQFAGTSSFVKERNLRQPGEPTFAVWNYDQTWNSQPLQFQLTISGEGSITNFKLQFDNYFDLVIPATLKQGDVVVCDGSQQLKIMSSNGSTLQHIKLTTALPTLQHGAHSVKADGLFEGPNSPKVECRFRGLIKTQEVVGK
jgi:hypothetical protein